MRGTKYKLTSEAFAELTKKLEDRTGIERFSPESIESARKIMVLGSTFVEVASEKEQSRQNLHRIVRDLWAISKGDDPPSREIHRKKEKLQLPESWVRVAATLPPDLAEKVKRLEAGAIATLEKTNRTRK